MRQHRWGRLWIIVAAICWGTTGTTQALAPVGASSVSIGAIRIAIGGLVLLLLALQQGQLRNLTTWPWSHLVLAAFSVATYQICFFLGVRAAGVAVGTVIALGSSPIIAGMLAKLTGEQGDAGWLPATLLALIGLALIVLPGHTNTAATIRGSVLCLGAGASYAVFTLASRSALLRNVPEQGAMAIAFSGGALLLLPLLITHRPTWLATPRGMAVSLHLGVVATALAYFCFSRGLRVTPAATATTLSLAEPLTAATLGIVILGERPGIAATCGMAMLFGSLAWLAMAPRRRSAQRSTPPPSLRER